MTKVISEYVRQEYVEEPWQHQKADTPDNHNTGLQEAGENKIESEN